MMRLTVCLSDMDQMYTDMLRDLEDEASRIIAFLKDDMPRDPDALMQRLSQISAYNARTGEMLADAEFILNLQRGEALDKLLLEDPKMPASQQKTLVDAMCAEAIRVNRLIERANRSAVHAAEAGITLVSYSKEEMSLSRKGY